MISISSFHSSWRALLSCILVIYCLLFFGYKAYAHPIDISTTMLQIVGLHVNGTVSLHSYQAQWLLTQEGLDFVGVGSFVDHSGLLEQYIVDNLTFSLDKEGKNGCTIQNISYVDKDITEILTNGVGFSFFAVCPLLIEKLWLHVTYFGDFPLQTNRVTIFVNVPGEISTTPHSYKIFTRRITSYEIDVSSGPISCIDTDGDGLCNEDEQIFGTNISNRDSDADCYSDYEEIYNSRDPLSKDLGPGQVSREGCALPGILSGSNQSVSDVQTGASSSLGFDGFIMGSSTFGLDYLRSVLQNMYTYTQDKKFPFWQLFLAVMFLGFIHAIGPGHAKGLMTSYLLDTKKTYIHGVFFSIFFAITHLADLALLFLGVYVLSWITDPTPYMPYIQFCAIIFLFVYSIWMFVVEWRKLKNKQLQEDDHHLPIGEEKPSLRQTFWVAFVSGLAPCTFGWSIFLLLFSLGRFDLILPMLGALVIGIYLCLQIIAFIVIYAQKSAAVYIEKRAIYAGIVSFGLLLCISGRYTRGLLVKLF